MKSLTLSAATILVAFSFNSFAATQPIEPILKPLVSDDKSINIHMGKYEVTVAEFTRFAIDTGYEMPAACLYFSSEHMPSIDKLTQWDHPELTSNPYRPVVCVGNIGAHAYANWLSEKTGKPYRLPNIEEWQLAATTGKPSRFAFGEDYQQTEICDYENIEDYAAIAGMIADHELRYESSANCNDGAFYHTVVGMYRPNALGFHDMIGNVRELLQSCHRWSEKTSETCLEYKIAGEAWHWQARGATTPDWIAHDFYGSIEGFRLVLDTPKKHADSAETRQFKHELNTAQEKARKAHNRLKSIPIAPTGFRALPQDNNEVKLEWNAVKQKQVTYSILRSYLDEENGIKRQEELVASDIQASTYVDRRPGKGPTSYRVVAKNPAGESMPSAAVTVGEFKTHSVGTPIEAEHFLASRHIWHGSDGPQEIIGFTANAHHHVSEYRPYFPAWLTFKFKNNQETKVKLKIRIKGELGAKLEIWQGHHRFGVLAPKTDSDFQVIELDGKLIAGNHHLQIRAANQRWFAIDWFEFEKGEN